MIKNERQLVNELNCEELFVLRSRGNSPELINAKMEEKQCFRPSRLSG